MDNTITISKNEYYNLRRDSEVLSRLENGGVDNWDWYSESIHSTSMNETTLDDWDAEMRKFLGI